MVKTESIGAFIARDIFALIMIKAMHEVLIHLMLINGEALLIRLLYLTFTGAQITQLTYSLNLIRARSWGRAHPPGPIIISQFWDE